MLENGKKIYKTEDRRKCSLCDGSLVNQSWDYIPLDKDVLAGLRNSINTGSKSGKGFLHEACVKALTVPIQRKLLLKDWSTRILNVFYEVWIRLDEYGSPIMETLASDIPEVDAEIQKLKQKKVLSEKEEAWLKERINQYAFKE